jgi:tetratricopeptide repeat protein
VQYGDRSLKKSASSSVTEKRVKELRTSVPVDLAGLMGIWRSRDVEEWSSSPGIYRLLGEKILDQGEPLLAYDVVSEGLKNCPDDFRLQQLQGLALARSGATERANYILEQLRAERQVDEETLGMLARTYKSTRTRTRSRAVIGPGSTQQPLPCSSEKRSVRLGWPPW